MLQVEASADQLKAVEDRSDLELERMDKRLRPPSEPDSKRQLLLLPLPLLLLLLLLLIGSCISMCLFSHDVDVQLSHQRLGDRPGGLGMLGFPFFSTFASRLSFVLFT